jgi:hypothetical protein
MTETHSLPRLHVADARSRLAETPVVITALCGGWPPHLWTVNEGQDTWCAAEVLRHLLHGEDEDWIPRLRQIMDGHGDRPFVPFDREEGFRKYGAEPPARLLHLFAQKRAAGLQTLDAWTLDPAALDARGTHPDLGAVTLEQLLATWVTHDFAHLIQLGRIAARHYGQWAGPWRAYLSVFRQSR